MKMQKIFLVVVCLTGILSGCFYNLCPNPKTDLLRLSADTRQWFAYSPGQTMLFRDESNTVDTLNVLQFTDTTEKYWQGDECPERPQEIINVKISTKIRTDTIVSVSGEHGNQLRITGKNIQSTYFTDNNRVFPDNDTYSASLNLRGRIFTKVLKVQCFSCNSNEVSELYFAKTVGLIGYTRNGKIWVRN